MDICVATWTCSDVVEWLRSVGFEKYVEYFHDNAMDGASLLRLGKEELFYLVKVFDEIFTLSDILKFEQCLAQLKEINVSSERALPSIDMTVEGFLGTAFSAPPTPAFVSKEPNWNWNEGGFEENVRVMVGAYPDFCWRYKSVNVLFKDFLPLSGGATNSFFANVSHIISPVDFYVQPTMIQPMVKKLHQHLQDVYSESTTAVPRENVFVGMPCVTRFKQDGEWYRAVIVDVVGVNEAPVRFIDWGNRQYSSFDDLKPLNFEFGRLPPAALQCRIKGVRERTLEQKVLEAFTEEMDKLGCELLVSISQSSVEPFLVQIFNKYTNEDLGKKYLPKEPICPKFPKPSEIEMWKKKRDRERAANAEAAAGEGETKVYTCDLDAFLEGAMGGYTSSDDDGGHTGEIKRNNKKMRKIMHQEKLSAQGKWPPKPSEDDERFRIFKLPNTDLNVQRRLRKQRKPMMGQIGVRVTHVQSTKEIYVQVVLEDDEGSIRDALIEIYGDSNKPAPDLPSDLINLDNACVIYEPNDAAWYRCRIAEITDEGVVLQAVDVGKRLPLIRPIDYARMKVLVRGSCLDSTPKAYQCRIDPLCDNQPTATETRLLSELLPINSRMLAEFERSREPYRLRLSYPETEVKFVDRFEKEIEERGLKEIIKLERRPCTDLTLWQRPKFVDLNEEESERGFNKKKEEERSSSPAEHPPINGTNGVEGATASAAAMAMAPSSSKIEENVTKKPSTDHGYANDIEAVLMGSVAVAGYDSEEELEKVTVVRNKRRVVVGRVPKTDEDDKDEKGSICDFTDERKDLVAKWLEKTGEENSVGVASAAETTEQKPKPKKMSAAAMYNPVLIRKPIGQSK